MMETAEINKKKHHFTFGKLILYIVLIVLTVAAFLPLFWILSTSFKEMQEIFTNEIVWIPENPTLENYQRAFEAYPLVEWMRNSILVTVWTILLSSIFYIMPAYALAKMEFKLKPLLMVLMLATIMIPKELSAIPVYKMVRAVNLMDTTASVIIPQVSEAIGVFLLVQFFRSIPDELIEASLLDGAHHWKILWRIFVPLSGPAVSVMIILTFVNSWNNFFWPLLVTFSEASMTLPVGMSTIMASYSEASAARQYGLLMAMSVIASLPTVIVFLALQNKFVEAVTSSSIKG
ncbi:carbohydrate ABC transporter permease [Ruminococcaceae bacterium OttesenSCG-928-I18]|nr:carbohydrate ABC transporter permease [Ruminococcaceae bacterium OttesenSCG-928-I18]